MKFESCHSIGDPVQYWVSDYAFTMAHVVGVNFSINSVTYDLDVPSCMPALVRRVPSIQVRFA